MAYSIKDVIMRNRSYRRFYHDKPMTEKQLEGLVDLARLSPSAANMQPLKFILSCKPEEKRE